MKPPHVEMVDLVTRELAERFAECWCEELSADLELVVQVGESVMTWPEGDEAAQERYQDIEDEILKTVIAMTKGAVAEAFFMAATVVLALERNR